MKYLNLWLLFVAVMATFVATPAMDLRNITGVTVSGLSSGAFASVQMQIAFSSLVDGSAIIAGGMYYGAQGNVLNALSLMDNPTLSLGIFETIANIQVPALAATGMIDPLHNLRSVNSWLFAGTKDTTVNPQNTVILKNFLQQYGVSVYSYFSIPAQHSFPTLGYGNQCDYSGSPFINDCHFDAAKELLTHLYTQRILPGVPFKEENLIQIDQAMYIPPEYALFSELDGINRLGYVYVPTNCREALFSSQAFTDRIFHGDKRDAYYYASTNTTSFSTSDLDSDIDMEMFAAEAAKAKVEADAVRERLWRSSFLKQHLNSTQSRDKDGLAVPGSTAKCAVHVAYHGCKQTLAHIGETYIRRTGYLPYAEANDIVVIFPQARVVPITNPNGCFDWWGYSGQNYHTRFGVQQMTFMNIATTVLAAMQN